MPHHEKRPIVNLAVLSAAAAAAWCACASARAELRGFDAMDIFKTQLAADPQISPDGREIVYVRRSADIMTDEWKSSLWIMSFDGADDHRLTTGSASESSPIWSPDGTRIAFISDRSGKPQIYVRWMKTGRTAKITNAPIPPSNISWSPNGKYIAFDAFVVSPPPEVAARPPLPRGAKWAPWPQAYESLIYRLNGVGYLPHGNVQLFVVPASGGAPRQVSTGGFPIGSLMGLATAAWSPDGQALYVSADRRSDYQYKPLDTDIYRFSLTTDSVAQLTHREGPDDSPQVSPDGRLIAYTGFDDRYQAYQTTYLYVMNRDGSDPHVISSRLGHSAQSPRWAPDGTGVYFMYEDQGDTKLGFCSLGGACREIEAHLASGSTAENIGANSFSIARDGRLAFTYGTVADAGDIASADAGGSGTRVLTNVNAALFARRGIGRVQGFWVRSSFDGRRIQAWVVTPPDFDPARKYPLILAIHGGPYDDYGDRFDFADQVWAAHGYVVVYANPRGSTSYGEEFANLTYHSFPGNDWYDLDSVVSAVEARGHIDKSREFVTGGSGGGVLTCWMIEHTDRFRAAASLYPVTDWQSWVLTADLTSYPVNYWFADLPWRNPGTYAKRSPLMLVDKVRTPTLLMTGDEDYRTPLPQVVEFYRALKYRHLDSALVVVPGGEHGLSSRPSDVVATTRYVLDWFGAHAGR